MKDLLWESKNISKEKAPFIPEKQVTLTVRSSILHKV